MGHVGGRRHGLRGHVLPLRTAELAPTAAQGNDGALAHILTEHDQLTSPQ
jgi:hypothetical protein